ncbi:myelin-associated glycoprotein-like [Mustelus asterias]
MFPFIRIALSLALLHGSCEAGWVVDLPSTLTAQRGLCVVIPCHYQYPSGVTPTQYVGIWLQLRKSVRTQTIYNSSDSQSQRNRFRLSGQLEDRDCSLSIDNVRHQDSSTYQFRIELGGSSKYTYSKRVHLHVSDPTEKPTVSHREDVVEGREVTVTCTFLTNCTGTQATLNWLQFKPAKRSYLTNQGGDTERGLAVYQPPDLHSQLPASGETSRV